MLVNRPEFNLVDTAALHLGATPFSVYNTSHARAGRVPVRQRRQPRGDHRAAVPAGRARGRGAPSTSCCVEDGTIALDELEDGRRSFDFDASVARGRAGRRR